MLEERLCRAEREMDHLQTRNDQLVDQIVIGSSCSRTHMIMLTQLRPRDEESKVGTSQRC